jgi:hypothetical protein
MEASKGNTVIEKLFNKMFEEVGLFKDEPQLEPFRVSKLAKYLFLGKSF